MTMNVYPLVGKDILGPVGPTGLMLLCVVKRR